MTKAERGLLAVCAGSAIIVLLLVFAIKTSRPIEVMNQQPQMFLCEGTVQIRADGVAVYDSPECQKEVRE